MNVRGHFHWPLHSHGIKSPPEDSKAHNLEAHQQLIDRSKEQIVRQGWKPGRDGSKSGSSRSQSLKPAEGRQLASFWGISGRISPINQFTPAAGPPATAASLS